MGRKKSDEESIVEESIVEESIDSEVIPEATVSEDITTLLLKFEDLTISQKQIFSKDGTNCSIGYMTIIDKKTGGISDHTYNMFASGEQKNWYLYRENEPSISNEQKGNRPFHWEGELTPGLYTFGTGPVPNFSTPKKSRVPGRGYQVKFRI